MELRIKLISSIIAGVMLLPFLGFKHRQQKEREYVIGQERANAAEVEAKRKQKGNTGISPMPKERYDFWHGDESVLNPAKVPLDSTLKELCNRFAKNAPQARARIRYSIDMEEFDTLLTFSNRVAVFAIREQNAAWITSGLTAIAMIEYDRTDFRDILIAMSLLYYSAKRIGQDADAMFFNTAVLAEQRVAALLQGYTKQNDEYKNLRNSWGRDEVQTKDGIGFIGWQFQKYNPTSDLKKISMEIGDLISADKYQPADVSIASDLPPYWLESADNTLLTKALSRVKAGASIHGRLRPKEDSSYQSNILMIFLVEVEDESTAQTLLELSQKKKHPDYCMIGIAQDKLFCLVVGRSFVAGGKSFETPESMARFSKGIKDILSKNLKAN
jgi:hypothetical protein